MDIQDRVAEAMMKLTLIGSIVGLIAFIFVGAIPGLLYGGHMGLMMAGALIGAPVEATLFAKFIVGGGMLMGFFATLFLFLVSGAIGGTVVAIAGKPIIQSAIEHKSRH